jgi:hypothetical protein
VAITPAPRSAPYARDTVPGAQPASTASARTEGNVDPAGRRPSAISTDNICTN